ncbi:PilZ domain-containing protein [Sphingomonas parva]|uniref:PilZ domain-containing protein n=1 Tax=Sphingomonas parva TaxID=2555898 RepID=A0A4Y8ZS87_9SPHN|nr:PilZ domain-containing protein [Sphingomonas parva]TFI57985.1 PilZ domain-containing protein [Sphingomonas parva]
MRYGSFRKSTKSFETPPTEVARSARVDLSVVSAIEVNGQRVNVQVSDFSGQGVGGRCAMPLPIGAEGSISLPRLGTVPIQIRWAFGGRFGARFAEGVDADALLPAPVIPAE